MGEGSENPILVVDDEKTVLDLVQLLLKREGYEVITANSAYLALSLLDKRFAEMESPKIAGILCDWKMPGWDGLRFLGELRKKPYGKIPFILMSGAVSPEKLQEAAITEEADAILVKPVNQTTLIEKVKKTFFSRQES